MKITATIGICLFAVLGSALAAATEAPPPPDGWTGKGAFGYVMSRGNTDADSANGKFDLGYIHGPWKHTFSLDALYGKSGEIASAQRWSAALQSNYTINPRTFGFGALNYENDKFSGFQYQASAAAGLGYKLLDTETNKLSVQAGVGYRRLRPEQLIIDTANGAVVARIPGDVNGNVIGVAGLDFAHTFNASTQLTNKFALETGSANTMLRNDLALQVKMSKALALSVGYSVRENTKPPAGLKKIDTLSTVNLVYAFGQT